MSEAPTIEPKELVENSGRPAVVVVDLHKSFGALEVLKGISLAARQGDVVSILGPSGSGKSTMLRCINLLETPDSGTIGVGEETLRVAKNPNGRVSVPDQRQVERLRRSTGMVFQRFNLWSHMTILQNVVEAPIHVLKRPRVFDDDGNRYIEGLSGLFCASLGFSEERLVEAATRQMRKLPFYHSFGGKTNERGKHSLPT